MNFLMAMVAGPKREGCVDEFAREGSYWCHGLMDSNRQTSEMGPDDV